MLIFVPFSVEHLGYRLDRNAIAQRGPGRALKESSYSGRVRMHYNRTLTVSKSYSQLRAIYVIC
jgi:hypothetical protein